MKSRKKVRYRRDAFVFRLFRPIFQAFACRKFKIKVKSTRIGEPTLILCNHNTDMDFSVIAAMFKDPFYAVCSQHVVENGWSGKLLRFLFHPITVYKGSMKTAQVLDIRRRLENGRNVLLFPEGRLSHNGQTCAIAPSVAGLAKFCHCRVITVRLSGGFFMQPRWQLYINPGKLFSYGVVGDYSKEEVASLSEEALYDRLCADLYVDAYAEQKKRRQPFTLLHGVEGVERYYTVCPACHSLGNLTVRDRHIACTCGFSMNYDEYGFFDGDSVGVHTAKDWERVQNETFDRLLASADRAFYVEDTVLRRLGDTSLKKERCVAPLCGYADRMEFGDNVFYWRDLEGADVLGGGSTLVFTCHGVHYELHKDGTCLQSFYYAFCQFEKINRPTRSAGRHTAPHEEKANGDQT